jgi:NADH dehydrogenase [ubiquinone] 1 alpha subcomplex assembly factor 7
MSEPPPYDPNAQRDTPLALKLKAQPRFQGTELSRFMSDCLWDEDHGYYRHRSPIGAAGDFITAPEISQVFGELLGLWAAVVWQQMGQPETVTLLEAGPGRGTLMRDALRAIDRVPAFRKAAQVHLMEASASLEAWQRDVLASARVPMTWSRHGEGIQGPLIVLANEFLDCLPIDQAEKTDQGWRLRCVGLDETQQFCVTFNSALRAFPEFDGQFPDAPLGSVFEFTQSPEPLGLAALAKDHPVAALYIDYGHTTPCLGETLQAVRRHTYEPIFCSPGEADLSAHVDFAAVAVDAKRQGLAVDGPVTQAEFLGSLGIMERASRLIAANPEKANDIETGIARLMAPNGMGTRFKVLGVRSPGLPPLPGFPQHHSRRITPHSARASKPGCCRSLNACWRIRAYPASKPASSPRKPTVRSVHCTISSMVSTA